MSPEYRARVIEIWNYYKKKEKTTEETPNCFPRDCSTFDMRMREEENEYLSRMIID
jgi:hypothetical protein